jgi:hypothetical protein
MVATPASEVSPDLEQGLFSDDTRLLSSYKLSINMLPWTPASSAAVSYFGARYVFLSPKFKSPDGTVEPGKLALHLDRVISEGGIHEDSEIINYSQGEHNFEFGIIVQCDFADIFEVKRHQVRQREIESFWDEEKRELSFLYQREDYERGVIYKINNAPPEPRFANGAINFGIELAPGKHWQLCCSIIPIISGKKRKPHSNCRSAATGDRNEQGLQRGWYGPAARIGTPRAC